MLTFLKSYISLALNPNSNRVKPRPLSSLNERTWTSSCDRLDAGQLVATLIVLEDILTLNIIRDNLTSEALKMLFTLIYYFFFAVTYFLFIFKSAKYFIAQFSY